MAYRLPYELIGATLAFSDIAELQAAACASRALQLQAEPHLYRHVLLTKTGSAAQFYAVVTRCAERACYVRGLIVADFGVARAQLSNLLALLQNLKILQLRVCADGIEARAYPFRLTDLSIYADGDGLEADQFVRFLNDCGGQALERLDLPLSANIVRHAALAAHVGENPATLANVTTLCAPYDVILAFIRGGAPLQRIFAPVNDVVQDELFEVIDAAKCNVRTLCGLRALDGYELLKTLGKVCPRLHSAELMIDEFPGLGPFAVKLALHQQEKSPAVHAELRSLSVRLIAPDGSLKFISEATMKDMLAGLDLCFPKLIRLNGYAFL